MKIVIRKTYPSFGSKYYPYELGEHWIRLGLVKKVYPLFLNFVIVVFQNIDKTFNREMKYRIIEEIVGFYPQEKKCFLCKWKYIDNMVSHHTWDGYTKHHSIVSTYDEALKVVEKRKQYLKDKKFKKIHNL